MKKVLFFLLLLLLFFLRLQFLPKLNLKDGQSVKVTGILKEEPRIFGSRQTIKLGHFEAVIAKYPDFHYGEEIEIVGNVKTPSFAKATAGRQDSNVKSKSKILKLLKIPNHYLLLEPTVLKARPYPSTSLGVNCKASPCNARFDFCRERPCSGFDKLTTGTAGSLPAKLAISLKSKILTVYKKSFPTTFDGIMAGVVLGDKSLIQKDFWDKLKATGTLHMMVASGMNIAMVSGGLLTLLCALFVRKTALLVLVSLIWFYTLMVGFQPPIVRAAIMASLIYLGQFFGRQTEGGRILLATGLIMIFLSPELLFDVGFQLSFLATGGLVWIQPVLKKRGEGVIPAGAGIYKGNNFKFEILNLKSIFKRNECLNFKTLRYLDLIKNYKLKIKNYLLYNDNFTSSLSAQLATLPILLLTFGQVNLISPLINLLVLWTIPFLLQAGMVLGLLGILGSVGMVLGKTASYLLYPLLFYLEQIISWSAKLTVFQWQAPKIGWWFGAVYYLGIWLWIRRDSSTRSTRSE